MAFRLLAMTGIRRSELVGLRWTDVDFAGRRLMIRQAVTAVRGAEVVDAPKSRRSRRNVDLDDITLAMLDRYRTEQRADLLALGIRLGPEDRIFRAPSGSPVRPDTVGQAFRRLAERSGLPVIRLHDLRHTHASHLLAAGVNVKIVSERLGHASTSFTMDTYGHVLPGQQAEAARVAASLVATGTTTLPEQLR
jgi:integrase